MSIYRRHDVLPEWEPVPYTLNGPAADEQELGFYQRAQKAIQWFAVPFSAFPPEGVLGYDRSWFISRDIDYWAVHDGEDLMLVRLFWHGFPDPPEWGLHSRPSGLPNARWKPWGHVPDLPGAWSLPAGDVLRG